MKRAQPRNHGGARQRAGRKASPLKPLVTEVETKATAAEIARPYFTEAIGALVSTIRDRRAGASARNAAAKHILDVAKPAEGADEALDIPAGRGCWPHFSRNGPLGISKGATQIKMAPPERGQVWGTSQNDS